VLFGEPGILRDRFEIHATHRDHAAIFARVAPAAPQPKGWPNAVLQSDRVMEIITARPGIRDRAIAAELGFSDAYVGVLRRIAALPEEIKKHMRPLGPLVTRTQVTGRDLRRLLAVRNRREQIAKFRALLATQAHPANA
jgi:hypothetical protein